MKYLLFRERRRERKKVSRKDRLKISAENNSVAQAVTRASQAIMNKQQGKCIMEWEILQLGGGNSTRKPRFLIEYDDLFLYKETQMSNLKVNN